MASSESLCVLALRWSGLQRRRELGMAGESAVLDGPRDADNTIVTSVEPGFRNVLAREFGLRRAVHLRIALQQGVAFAAPLNHTREPGIDTPGIRVEGMDSD